MTKLTKKKYLIIGAMVALLAIGAWGTLYANCPKRAVKNTLCAESPAMCRCYSNIVDYRMTAHEIAITHRYQKELKQYGMVSPLEFASLEEVQHLNILLNVCQMEQMKKYMATHPQQQVQPEQQPIQSVPQAQPNQPVRK